MKRTIPKNSILVGALLGVMVVGQTMAADLRYQQPGGDWTNTVAIDGFGWQAGGGGPNGLPGTADTARLNWGKPNGVTVTLSSVAPLIRRFQFGVNESGNLVVNAGGLLTTREASYIGNNDITCNASVTVNTGGGVTVTGILYVGHGTVGALTNDGGTVSCSSHLWTGSQATGVGTIVLTNGGSLSVGGNIGLGTVNAIDPTGGKCSLYVQEGGVLNLANISPATSIQPNSVLDISGSGVVRISGDRVATMSAYTNAGRITAYGGLGTIGIDYNNTNVGKTTLWAIAPAAPPPTNSIWIATSGAGMWSQGANWDSGVVPFIVTKVNFNVPGTIPCTVTNPAIADYVLMGESGPGGSLTISNGGSLTCGAVSASVIGLNSNALMTVQTGGSAAFGAQLRIGLDPGSDGTLIMNGGTVSVAGMLDLGAQGGKGTAQINGGTLNLAQFDSLSIQGASLMDVTGTGKVVINGDQTFTVASFVSTGQITNSVGTNVAMDYNNLFLGKTTIYPAGLYVAPERATWDPASNPSGNGFWNESSNWVGGFVPGSVTLARFNILGATPCTVSNAAVARAVRMGLEGGPGGTLIITNGGSLVCTVGEDNWNAVGYSETAELIVEAGGSASFGNHLWVGFNATGNGTFIMNGGTVSVTGQFGLGWNGGTGTAQINGGTLNLAQLHPTDSIKGSSILNLSNTAVVVITGNHLAPVANYIAAGKITANGGPNVYYAYYPSTGKTVLSAVVLPPPPQTITAVSVSGGNVSVTYQTTAQNTYHIEGTPSLSAPLWTPVPGSTNTATGTPVTFSFPASGSHMFYRTVSVTP